MLLLRGCRLFLNSLGRLFKFMILLVDGKDKISCDSCILIITALIGCVLSVLAETVACGAYPGHGGLEFVTCEEEGRRALLASDMDGVLLVDAFYYWFLFNMACGRSLSVVIDFANVLFLSECFWDIVTDFRLGRFRLITKTAFVQGWLRRRTCWMVVLILVLHLLLLLDLRQGLIILTNTVILLTSYLSMVLSPSLSDEILIDRLITYMR